MKISKIAKFISSTLLAVISGLGVSACTILIDSQTPPEQPQEPSPKQFVKNGNNGTVSCQTFCGNSVDWPSEYGDGICVSAKNEFTGENLSCDTVPGLIPEGRQLTCTCEQS